MSKNILMVGSYPPHQIGGGESQQQLLSRMFKKNGYNVFVLSMGINKIFEVYDEDGIKIYRVGKFKENRRGNLNFLQAFKYITFEIFDPLLFIFTIFLTIRYRVNSVHVTNFNQMSLSPIIASKILMRNTVVTMHSHSILCFYSTLMPFCYGVRKGRCGNCLLRYHKLPESAKKFEFILKPILNWTIDLVLYTKFKIINSLTDKIIFPSEYSKKIHLKYGTYAEKAKVIHCMLNDFKVIKKQSKKKNGKKVILYIGKIEEEKGVKVLMKSAKKLLNNNHRWKLLIIGEGRSFKKINKLMNELKLNEHVAFLGLIPHYNMPNYYRLADIVVIPSVVPETFSIVLLEANLSRKITICSRIGALEERVIEGKTGFLVEPNNSDELAKKMLFVLENYEKLKHIEERAYTDAVKKYNPENGLSEYKKILG